ELFQFGGAADYYAHKVESGFEWLRRVASHFERKVWLNPEPPRFWRHHTVTAIRGLFPMFPLTLEGLDEAIRTLVKGKAPHPVPATGPVWG
ncbi:MAG TPA: VWA containing CoxE family protein, partial [Polyangia bacterium]